MPFKRSFHIYLYCRRAHICLCRRIYTAAAHIYVYAAAFILLLRTYMFILPPRRGSYSCGAVWLRTGLSGPRVLAAWAKLRRKFYDVRAAALLRPQGLSSEFLFSASFSGAREFWLCLPGPGLRGCLSFRPCALFKALRLVLRIFIFRPFFWRRGSLGLGFKYEIPLRVIINYEEQHVAGQPGDGRGHNVGK